MPDRKLTIKSEDEKFRLQRERLEHFYHNLHLKLRVVLGEMEGDIRVLKEQDFPRDTWRAFVNLWRDLLDISHQLTPEKPYQAASKLVGYVKTRPHRSIIDNLEFLTEHHLQTKMPEFQAGPKLQPVQVRSLRLLKTLADHVEKFMADNPLLDVPAGIAPTTEPALTVKPEEFKPAPVQPQEKTYIPPAKKK